MKLIYIFFIFFCVFCSRITKTADVLLNDYSYLNKVNKALVVVKIHTSFFNQLVYNSSRDAILDLLNNYNYELDFLNNFIQMISKYENSKIINFNNLDSLEEDNITYQAYINKDYPQDLLSKGYDLVFEFNIYFSLFYDFDYLKARKQHYFRLINPKNSYIYSSQEKIVNYDLGYLHNFENNNKNNKVVLNDLVSKYINESIDDIILLTLKK